RSQINPLAGAAEALRQASDRAETCRAALADVALETLAADLAALGADPLAGLRRRRQQLSKDAATARAIAGEAAKAHTLADERTRSSRAALDAAVLKRDTALTSFPDGVDAALTAAQADLAGAIVEK